MYIQRNYDYFIVAVFLYLFSMINPIQYDTKLRALQSIQAFFGNVLSFSLSFFNFISFLVSFCPFKQYYMHMHGMHSRCPTISFRYLCDFNKKKNLTISTLHIIANWKRKPTQSQTLFLFCFFFSANAEWYFA